MPVRKLQPLEAKMNQEHVAQYVFRRLPGIAELTKIWGDGKSWGPEMDGFSDRCDALAIRLFGLKTSETIPRFYDDVSDFGILVGERFLPMTRELGDVFDAQFDITKAPHHVKLAAYLEAGWDVSDGQGYEHPLLNRFERPLLCGLADLIPGVNFLPPEPGSDAEAAASAEEWAMRLTAKPR
jgi:hypothetical protein